MGTGRRDNNNSTGNSPCYETDGEALVGRVLQRYSCHALNVQLTVHKSQFLGNKSNIQHRQTKERQQTLSSTSSVQSTA
jgi:hypothetical protein